MSRQLPLVILLSLALAGCSDSTRRHPSDGDADGDIDVVDPCDEGETCDEQGFGVEYDIEIEAEVVETNRDEVVLLGADGIPLTFNTCGLNAAGLVPNGSSLRARNYQPDGWGDCWLSTLQTDDGPLAFVGWCEGEGPVSVAVGDMDWTVSLEPACEGEIRHVCTDGGGLRQLAIPQTVYDVEVTTETGARETVAHGESGSVGDWLVRLLDARSTDPVEDDGCFARATGRILMSAISQPTRNPCVEPPEVDRSALGLSVAAAETIRELTVYGVDPELVTLRSDEGVEITYGWFGPDARRAVAVGQRVIAQRHSRDATHGSFLDVIRVGGRMALAVTTNDDFVLEVPNLEVIGVALELGDPCRYEDGVAECTGDTLISERYPVAVHAESSAPTEVLVGETEEAGPWLVTLLEASQYPAVTCPDRTVEAWAPFGITLMQEMREGE